MLLFGKICVIGYHKLCIPVLFCSIQIPVAVSARLKEKLNLKLEVTTTETRSFSQQSTEVPQPPNTQAWDSTSGTTGDAFATKSTTEAPSKPSDVWNFHTIPTWKSLLLFRNKRQTFSKWCIVDCRQMNKRQLLMKWPGTVVSFYLKLFSLISYYKNYKWLNYAYF